MITINQPELNTHIEGLLATISGLENLEQKHQRHLVKAGKISGEVIARGVQSEITDAQQIFKINRKGRTDLTYPGQLKRATKVWKIRGTKINVFVGMKRGKALAGDDGWFAWIVNHGHIGGEGNYDGPNKGFWGRGVAKSFPAAQRLYGAELSRIVGKIID
jgi:hypothetical protein